MKTLGNRARALAIGEKRYEGVPCIHGHGTTRLTKTYECVKCLKLREKRNRKAHFDAMSPEEQLASRSKFATLKKKEHRMRHRPAPNNPYEWARRACINARKRATKYNLPFNITPQTIVFPEK